MSKVITGDETEEQVRAQANSKTIEEMEQDDRDAECRRLLSTKAGRGFLWQIIGLQLGLFASPSHAEPRQQERNVAKHEIALALFVEWRALDPLGVNQMIQENLV